MRPHTDIFKPTDLRQLHTGRIENVTTPYLKLKSLDSAQRYLRPGVTFEQLDSVAVALDDLAAARLVNAARDQLFREIERREAKAA